MHSDGETLSTIQEGVQRFRDGDLLPGEEPEGQGGTPAPPLLGCHNAPRRRAQSDIRRRRMPEHVRDARTVACAQAEHVRECDSRIVQRLALLEFRLGWPLRDVVLALVGVLGFHHGARYRAAGVEARNAIGGWDHGCIVGGARKWAEACTVMLRCPVRQKALALRITVLVS